jgi:SAM-dependent methyltransferase
LQGFGKDCPDVFGYHALQLGHAERDFLRESRMPLRAVLSTPGEAACLPGKPALVCDFAALPVASQSVDLALLPHALEFAADPHAVLREVERILIPEGQAIITGFNPFSLFGAKRRLSAWFDSAPAYPWNGRYLSVLRLRDWLKLLGFEVDRGAFGCYAPPVGHAVARIPPLELAGARWWAMFGDVYLLRAVKRVKGMRLIGRLPWKKLAPAPLAIKPLAHRGQAQPQKKLEKKP